MTAAPPRPALAPDADATTLAESAYRELRERILTLDLAPGAAFSEGEVAERLGLSKSKTPIREALLRLRLEGLVRVQPRAGYVVADVTLKDARDTLALRALLDGEAALRAAGRAAAAAAALRPLDAGARTRRTASLGERLAAEHRFHVAVARAGGNERLAGALDRTFAEYVRLAHLSAAIDPALALPQHGHATLLDAIAAGDAPRARDIARAEAQEAERRVVDALVSSESLATANVLPAPASNRFYLDVPKPRSHDGGRS